MKKTWIFLFIMVVVSLITPLGLSSSLSYSIHQPIQDSQGVINGSPLTAIDLEKLVSERNAQKEHLMQVSRGSTPQKELVGEFKLTFYSPSPDETDDTPIITASGAQVKPGITVAVDPRYWELGTKFYIEGYGYVVAEDTGSKIKGPRTMDVSVETKDQALKKGIQYRNVWVVNG